MKISKKNRQKISEQILAYLFSINPQPAFTSHIAGELARDEEFIKNLLEELRKKGLLVEINKNPKGADYIKRKRWQLSERAYQAYGMSQPVNKINNYQKY